MSYHPRFEDGSDSSHDGLGGDLDARTMLGETSRHRAKVGGVWREQGPMLRDAMEAMDDRLDRAEIFGHSEGLHTFEQGREAGRAFGLAPQD